jgi:uncharacterized alkaline shock family protein YloU
MDGMQALPNGLRGLAALPRAAALAPHVEPLGHAAPAEQLGSVRIARRVLRTVVEQAALHVPGVARMARARGSWQHLLGRALPQHGVSLLWSGAAAVIDLYIVVESGFRMVDVGMGVQEAVGAAVEHSLGIQVSEINVYIQDVA